MSNLNTARAEHEDKEQYDEGFLRQVKLVKEELEKILDQSAIKCSDCKKITKKDLVVSVAGVPLCPRCYEKTEGFDLYQSMEKGVILGTCRDKKNCPCTECTEIKEDIKVLGKTEDHPHSGFSTPEKKLEECEHCHTSDCFVCKKALEIAHKGLHGDKTPAMSSYEIAQAEAKRKFEQYYKERIDDIKQAIVDTANGNVSMNNPSYSVRTVKYSVGRKDDDGKLDWTLLPYKSLEGAVKRMMWGEKQYGRDNWKQVDRQRYKKALMRHLYSYIGGDNEVDETGGNHLDGVILNAMFVRYLDE